MVVDNDPVDRELLSNLLVPLGFNVIEAASGMECITLYQTLKPDVIFLDLAMPEMDGWETAHIIRNVHFATVKICIVSANAFDRGLENSSGITADDFMPKPINLFELINWLERALAIQWIHKSDDNKQLAKTVIPPPQETINKLMKLLEMGNMTAIHQCLEEVTRTSPHCRDFVETMTPMLASFDLDGIKQFLEKYSNER